MGWGERGIRPAILVEDLDTLLVALGALHALPPRCEIVVVVHDGCLEAFDAIGASQRCEAPGWGRLRLRVRVRVSC